MNTTKTDLISRMETYFGDDAKRINHARKVTEYAEALLEREGGDYTVVIGAAVLHDIGIHEAEKKYGSASGKYQEIEGPPVARPILQKLGFNPEQIREICDIIGSHHSPGKITTLNFKIVFDADWLVNLRDEYDTRDKDKLSRIIEKVFLTTSGRELARGIFLGGTDGEQL